MKMIALNNYIKESIDIENLHWKINTWFYKRPNEQNTFNDLCNKYKGINATKDSLQDYFNGSDESIKPFIDFLDDCVYNDSNEKDYMYLLGKVIDNINANKAFE